ncbi:hypothetical protein PBY51_016925 [Eleginops maclovinus]|uniref:Uncharacterized protein n=1 Tax=Eleginops maclovinus TaxID=56733 RepID=A0AAN7ZU83_ELEMC|nr:hypothetical protein PBY51_016925 [Eleginops maclovinus]
MLMSLHDTNPDSVTFDICNPRTPSHSPPTFSPMRCGDSGCTPSFTVRPELFSGPDKDPGRNEQTVGSR